MTFTLSPFFLPTTSFFSLPSPQSLLQDETSSSPPLSLVSVDFYSILFQSQRPSSSPPFPGLLHLSARAHLPSFPPPLSRSL